MRVDRPDLQNPTVGSSKLNLITVCTQNYPMHYAEKLIRRFQTLTNLTVESYCITDRPNEVTDWAMPIVPPRLSEGWWNKLNIFSPSMPDGWLLYLDLDIVILQNFDEEITCTLKQGENINCVSDAINWMGVRFSSSFMLLRSGVRPDIYDDFIKNEKALVNKPGGDQVWIGPKLDKVHYIDDSFPNLKKNLKFDLATKNKNEMNFPKVVDDRIKLIDCGGQPKPHQLARLLYIKNNWHDVPPIVPKVLHIKGDILQNNTRLIFNLNGNELGIHKPQFLHVIHRRNLVRIQVVDVIAPRWAKVEHLF